MTYNEWRDELKKNLLGVPDGERNRVLDYYAEAYADRREAGASEKEIIEQFGAPYDAAQRILHEEGKAEEKSSEPVSAASEQPKEEAKEEVKEEAKEEPSFDSPTLCPYAAPEEKKEPVPAAEKCEEQKVRLKPVFIVLISVGAAFTFALLFLIIVFSLNRWRFSPKFETKTFTSEGTVEKICVEIDAGRFTTEFYDGTDVIVQYPVSELVSSSVSQEGTVITVTGPERLEWYAFSSRNWRNLPPTIVKIPQSAVYDINLTVNAGTVDIETGAYGAVEVTLNAGTVSFGDITCNKFACEVNAGTLQTSEIVCPELKCEVNAGAASMALATVSGKTDIIVNAGSVDADFACNKINLTVNAGSVNLDIVGNKTEYTIAVEKNLGSCNVAAQTGTDPEKLINVNVRLGSVDLDFVTA